MEHMFELNGFMQDMDGCTDCHGTCGDTCKNYCDGSNLKKKPRQEVILMEHFFESNLYTQEMDGCVLACSGACAGSGCKDHCDNTCFGGCKGHVGK